MANTNYYVLVTITFRIKLLLFALLLATTAVAMKERPKTSGTLADWLKNRWGLEVTSQMALDPGTAYRDGLWVVLAQLPRNHCNDLYVVRARLAPNGVPIRVSTPINLTLSEWANDDNLQVNGTQVATVVRNHNTGKIMEVHVRDLSGEWASTPPTPARTRTENFKNATLRWAETGSTQGIALQVWQVDPPTERVQITWRPDQSVSLQAPNTRFERIDTETREQLPTLNWVANLGRRLEGLGPAVELLKEFYFVATEVIETTRSAVTKPKPETLAQEAPQTVVEARKRAALQIKNDRTPWPPAPLRITLPERREGEGIWAAVDDKRVTKNPNAREPFYQTFIRIDPKRSHKKVAIVIWDPAQVILRFQAGRVEPIPSTGLRGRGYIPRKKQILSRAVAGFNGGFQSFHGRYGALSERRLHVPPIPGIATVISTEDGRAGFGTWSSRSKIDESLLDLRQNLPPLVEDGMVNPYGIVKWGASQDVAGADGALTVRSGICHTRDNYVAYLYCQFCDASGLGKAMTIARCDYGIHLDMNAGHSGFEFFKNIPRSDRRQFSSYNVHEVEQTDQYFHVTRLVRYMWHMHFPRYLKMNFRDFFYLVLRPVMPGEGEWRTHGLAGNDSYPPAVAIDIAQPKRFKIDPNRFKAQITPRQDNYDAPMSLIETKNLTLGLSFANATLHRRAGITLKPIGKGRLVMAINNDHALELIKWDPALEQKYPNVVTIPNAQVTRNGFLVFEPTKARAYQPGAEGLLEGPIDGGEGVLVTDLIGPNLRLLLSLKPQKPFAYRF